MKPINPAASWCCMLYRPVAANTNGKKRPLSGLNRLFAFSLVLSCVSCSGPGKIKDISKEQNTQPHAVATVRGPSGTPELVLEDGARYSLDSAANGTLQSMAADISFDYWHNKVFFRAKRIDANSSNALSPYNQLSTPPQTKCCIRLPDGTEAWLNGSSKLMFPTAFTGKERRVMLSGEAFFIIAHRDTALGRDAPFMVSFLDDQKNTQVARLQGTWFNIRAYPEIPEKRITAFDGYARLTDTLAAGINRWKPGRHLLLDTTGVVTVLPETRLSADTAWLHNDLIFGDTPVASVLQQIGVWYGVHFVGAEKFREQISGNLRLTDPFETIRKVMAEAAYLQFQGSGDTLFVSRRPAH